jgi:hypothetical protein
MLDTIWLTAWSVLRLYNKNRSRAVRPIFSQKRRPHFKTFKSLEKKNMVMCLDRTWNQELLCWWGPTAI